MANFERGITRCINRFFTHRQTHGFACRLKQSKFNTRYVDVLVNSLDPRYYPAIECKSISGKKPYFSQHFHSDKNNVRQIDAITDFIRRTGRRGFLAVEFRFGAGMVKEAYLMPGIRFLATTGTPPASRSTISGFAVRSPAPVRSTICRAWIQINILSHHQ
ncbi:PDDEXK family nuclease [Methanoculleus nereidis]|uniref:Holliday junction resolvase n=1 Tax=Methanoculleus nereidis TaxID=2735141 RepID=UPI0029423728|nr:Holliday junction resolvase [Methanoculleus sp. YWC-01]